MFDHHTVQKFKVKTVELRIGLRLGSKICKRHNCVCGKDATEDVWHGLSCLKIARSFSRHLILNAHSKQSLYSTQILSVLDPRHLHRTNQKRSNGLTLVPWAVAEQLLWNVMVVDSIAPSRISAGSNWNPGTPLLKRKSKK